MKTELTKSAVLEQENKLYDAIKGSDITALEELLHDDLLFVLPGGQVITKEMDLNTYREGTIRVDELLPAVENLNILDDTAVITLILELKGTFNQAPFEATYRYIRFWKRFEDGIRVIGGSGTAI